MSRFFVLPYNAKSEGAKALAEALPDGLKLRLEGSEYKYRDGDTVANWGNGVHGRHPVNKAPKGTILNDNVDVCINKLTFFTRLAGHFLTPAFATSAEEALRHLPFPIVARMQVEGADGQGITVVRAGEKLPKAPLYTRMIDKAAEYRVHVGRQFSGVIGIIYAQKKSVKAGAKLKDPAVWTGDDVALNWVAVADLPITVRNAATKALEAMPELTYCGLDIVWEKGTGNAYVLEANSAPMLTPDSAKAYAKFITTYAELRDAGKPKPVPVAEPVAKRAAGVREQVGADPIVAIKNKMQELNALVALL